MTGAPIESPWRVVKQPIEYELDGVTESVYAVQARSGKPEQPFVTIVEVIGWSKVEKWFANRGLSPPKAVSPS